MEIVLDEPAEDDRVYTLTLSTETPDIYVREIRINNQVFVDKDEMHDQAY